MKFDVGKEVTGIVDWIKKYFVTNGLGKKAIVGISGGKDSALVAKLCVLALGPENVTGVLMPQGEQVDIEDSKAVVKWLGISYVTVNIGDTCEALYKELKKSFQLNSRVTSNTPARVRMVTLYAIAAIYGGRVANTCNASENYVGYATKFGDSTGDFAPIHNYYVTEIYEMCEYLGVPKAIINKAPADGLSGLSDEDNLGFPYEVLDCYLLNGLVPSYDILANIEQRHKNNVHKMRPMPCYNRSHNDWNEF